jgi:hypothetical protein
LRASLLAGLPDRLALVFVILALRCGRAVAALRGRDRGPHRCRAALVLANAFFAAAEFGLVGVPARIAVRGGKPAGPAGVPPSPARSLSPARLGLPGAWASAGSSRPSGKSGIFGACQRWDVMAATVAGTVTFA